jgi:hypothetical protein
MTLKTFNVSLLITFVLVGCSPVSISRIGPTQPSRGKGCEVEVIPPGEEPPRPYRDVGVVHLTNCQEYTAGPCRRWLVDSVCVLGGNVAYLPDPEPPKNDINATNFHVRAGIYVAESQSVEGVETCAEPLSGEDEPEMQRCMD